MCAGHVPHPKLAALVSGTVCVEHGLAWDAPETGAWSKGLPKSYLNGIGLRLARLGVVRALPLGYNRGRCWLLDFGATEFFKPACERREGR